MVEKQNKTEDSNGRNHLSSPHNSPSNASDVEKRVAEDNDGYNPDIVDFEGPHDQLNARNWPSKRKWSLVALLAAMTFVTPLSSSVFAPAVPEVDIAFHNDNLLLTGFVVSVYILGYAAGPLIVAPLSELYGRRWVYNISNVLFVIFSIACAVSSSLGMLIGFRFLAGFVGSTVISIGGGTVADLFEQEDRGKAMSMWSLGPLVGPVVGPVAGGFLSQARGWRWTFWLCAILGGAIMVPFLILNRETYAPTLLEQKTRRLRKETGNLSLRSRMDTGLTPTAAFKRAIVRPMKLLALSPICLFLALFVAVVYGYLYLLYTTITEVFQSKYGWSTGIAGLSFLGIGIGNFAGVFIFAVGSDRSLKKKIAKGITIRPEDRLPLLVPAGFLVPVGFFIYGWAVQYKVFWFVPLFGTFWVGLALMCIFMPVQTYLVDAFTLYASSALAANTLLRSVVGAILPLAGQPMYKNLGLGWGNSLLGFIALAMIPIPIVLLRYGERIRTSPRFQVKL